MNPSLSAKGVYQIIDHRMHLWLSEINTLLIPFPGCSGGRASQSCNINDFNKWFDKSTTIQACKFLLLLCKSLLYTTVSKLTSDPYWNDHLMMICPCRFVNITFELLIYDSSPLIMKRDKPLDNKAINFERGTVTTQASSNLL